MNTSSTTRMNIGTAYARRDRSDRSILLSCNDGTLSRPVLQVAIVSKYTHIDYSRRGDLICNCFFSYRMKMVLVLSNSQIPNRKLHIWYSFSLIHKCRCSAINWKFSYFSGDVFNILHELPMFERIS